MEGEKILEILCWRWEKPGEGDRADMRYLLWLWLLWSESLQIRRREITLSLTPLDFKQLINIMITHICLFFSGVFIPEAGSWCLVVTSIEVLPCQSKNMALAIGDQSHTAVPLQFFL